MDAFENHLMHCRRRAWGSVFRPIWEQTQTPGYLVQVPSYTTPCGILQPYRPALEEGADEVVSTSDLRLFHVKRTASDRTWEQQCSKQRSAVIRKLLTILTVHISSFALGRQWNKLDPLGNSLCSGLQHVFAGKSTGTLGNRAGPILRYVHWCKVAGCPPFPMQEGTVYKFMTDVGPESSPTFLRSYLVALAFCHYLLGLTGALEVIQSARISGCARESYLQKRKTKRQLWNNLCVMTTWTIWTDMRLDAFCSVFSCVRGFRTCCA